MAMRHPCLFTLVTLSVAALTSPNEEVPGLDRHSDDEISLVRAEGEAASSSRASLQAKAQIAALTGTLLKGEQEVSRYKLQIEALKKEEERQKHRTDLQTETLSQLESASHARHGVSEAAYAAQKNIVTMQNEMLQKEDELHELKKNIKSKADIVKTSKDKVQSFKSKSDDYSDGTRLAMIKANKLHQELYRARKELAEQKANLTKQKAAASTVEAKYELEHHDYLRQQVEAEATKEWQEQHVDKDVVMFNDIPESMSTLALELQSTKAQIKSLRRENKKQASDLDEQTTAEYHQVDLQHLESQREIQEVRARKAEAVQEQRQRLDAKTKHLQDVTHAKLLQKQHEADEELAPLRQSLQKQQENLKSEQKRLREEADERKKAKLDKVRAAREAMASHVDEKTRAINDMELDTKRNVSADHALWTRLQEQIKEMETDKKDEHGHFLAFQDQEREALQRLQTAKKRMNAIDAQRAVVEAELRRQMEKESDTAAATETAELERLKKEFQEIHAEKNRVVTELSAQVENLRKRQLRGFNS